MVLPRTTTRHVALDFRDLCLRKASLDPRKPRAPPVEPSTYDANAFPVFAEAPLRDDVPLPVPAERMPEAAEQPNPDPHGPIEGAVQQGEIKDLNTWTRVDLKAKVYELQIPQGRVGI